MTDNIDNTRNIDDETVEQLVENRFTPAKSKASSHSKKKKKRKNTALSILATFLGFILVFVLFFTGSYIIFSSTQKVEENVEVVASSDNAELSVKSQEEIAAEEPPVVFSDVAPEGEVSQNEGDASSENSEDNEELIADEDEDEGEEKPTQTQKPATQKPAVQKPADKKANTTTTKPSITVPSTDKKESSTSAIKKPAVEEKDTEVVKKAEESQGIVFE